MSTVTEHSEETSVIGGIDQTFVVGTRMSKLAMVQTNHVVDQLKKLHPNAKFEIRKQDTIGDRVQDRPLPDVGGKGLFTQELEDGLRDGSIDFAVHSLKDLPTCLPKELTLGCISERCDPRDVLLIRSDLVKLGFRTLADLNNSDNPDHWNIGSSSLRRKAQIKHMFLFGRRFNLNVIECRGNVDSRISKLEWRAKEIEMLNRPCEDLSPIAGAPTFADLEHVPVNAGDKNTIFQETGHPKYTQPYAAIILAYAGLERQGQEYLDRITSFFDDKDMLYSVGQGSLGVECRANDERVLNLLKPLQHDASFVRCTAERAFLEMLEGGCHAPIAVKSEYDTETGRIRLIGRVLSLDGKTTIETKSESDKENAAELGRSVASTLLHHGAAGIIAAGKK